MAEYIEREKAIHAARYTASMMPSQSLAIVYAIESIPAADMRPVVMCRDCKYWKQWGNTAYHLCTYVIGASSVRKADDFCSCGKKREES